MAEPVRASHGDFGRVALLQMTAALVPHAHPHRHLLFNLGGEAASFVVGSARVPLAEASGVAVNGWEPHHYPHAPGGGRPLILALYLEPNWLAAQGCGARFAATAVPARPPVVRLCQHLRTELLWGGRDARAAALLEEITAELVRLVAGEGPPDPSAGGVADFRVRHAMELMRANCGERMDAEAIAAACGVSRPHFFELFRRATGVSPTLYWNALRMERALADLAATDRPIGEVALDLGFSEQANFTRFFRAHQGVAPRDYRRGARPTLG